MKVHFRVLEVSVIDTYPTNYRVQIKMDFHCFDPLTAILVVITARQCAFMCECNPVCVLKFVSTHLVLMGINACMCTLCVEVTRAQLIKLVIMTPNDPCHGVNLCAGLLWHNYTVSVHSIPSYTIYRFLF